MWLDPVGNTPRIVQVDFGAWGQYVPGDGEVYCAPTSLVMALYWLYANGFTQLGPGPFVSQDDGDTINLERIIAGLMDTSSEEGTVGTLEAGVVTYLSACGISPSQHTYAHTDHPDLAWLATHLAPNFAQHASTIVLADFQVGWFTDDDNSFTNTGGHVLCPLVADVGNNRLTLNNAYPASFFDVPNEPAHVRQAVTLASVPAGLSIPPLPPPSDRYSHVISGNKGNGKDWAILVYADAWQISNSALPSTPGYAPATWKIDGTQQQIINTNGGTLKVLAPLSGSGGLAKGGLGTLLLTNTNALSGPTIVTGGTLASALASGMPFGSGALSLGGGGALALCPGAASALKVQIASADGVGLTLGAGDGALQVQSGSPSAVTIGGNTDGATPNIVRAASATLRLQPSQGMVGLGSGQLVMVAGTGANQPALNNGIVAPYILGQDIDSWQSGTFLTYGNGGFVPAATVSSTEVGINSVTPGTVYSVSDAQTIDQGATVQVAALALAGGTILGNATLQVGSQAAGDVAGVLINAGAIEAATLAFGAAEAVLYAGRGDPAGSGEPTIASTLSGSGGLTMTGPGTLELGGDNAQSLSGAVTINAGTLHATGSGSTGAGAVTVNSGAELQVGGVVNSAVTVAQSGTLTLIGGTVEGDVNIASIGQATSDPGGILQGAGTLNGEVQAAGNIQSGPTIGILNFTNTLILPSGSAFYWRLSDYVDNADCPPGVAWNALQITQPVYNIGRPDGFSIFLDFSLLGEDPDGDNPFWDSPRIWTIWSFDTDQWNGKWWVANATYLKGDFYASYDGLTGLDLYLNWKPAPTKRTPAERLAVQARVRPTIKQPTSLGSSDNVSR
jgi:autotransporter-associated beta strand protein